MDSQLTLVDACGIAPLDDHILFVFDRDDMRNTTLRIRGADRPSYTVDTLANTTTVRAGNRLLATIARKKFRPDQITFPGSRPMTLGSWLKTPVLRRSPLRLCTCGRRFEWREDDHPGQLVLWESGRSVNALAWFSESRMDIGGSLHAAYLAIKPEMVEMIDMIILSCLLAEHKLRVAAAGQAKTVLDTMILGF